VEVEMNGAPVIQLSSVTKRYGSTPAVDELTWSGGRGVIGLLGPNGAGKSTLLRMLATVLAQDDGEIRVFGLDPGVADERLAIRRRLGYLPQEAGLYRNFTAYDLVDYVAVLKEMTDRAARRDEVRRVLGDVGLTDDMHRRIRTLSGGMQRRVALAAALLGHPDLVVLDEPSAGLDPDQRLRLRTVLSDVGRSGTVLLSTHQTDEVAAFCQRVLVLDRGRLLFDGAPRDLANRAADRVWISDAPDAGAVRSWVTGDGDVRNIGMPPPGAMVVAPTLDDGYLLVATEDRIRT
jgi:ABC-2 type transport system ATP-binding protein